MAPRPLAILLRVFLAIFLVMFPVGMVLMLSGLLGNETLWTTSVFLAVQFLVTLTFMLCVAARTPALVATALLIAVSIGIEFTGVTTGYPFGRYYYSYFLEPFVIGNVPLAISFAWFTLVVNSYFLVLFLSGSHPGSTLSVALTGLLVLGLDLALEPFAAYVNRYWRWMEGSIPWQNFLSWVVLSLLFGFVLSRLVIVKGAAPSARVAAVPALVLGLNLFQFAVVNIVNGYWVLTAAGLSVSACAVVLSARRGMHAD